MKAKRVSLIIPPDWHEAIAEAAAEQNVSVSEYISRAAIETLPRRVRAELSERLPAHRPRAAR